MITSIPIILEENSSIPLYMQIYEQIKNFILSQGIKKDDKLPSLRSMSSRLKVSVTTVDLAYSQLLVEGYIRSKKNSGYFVDFTPPKDSTSTLFYENQNTDINTFHQNALDDYLLSSYSHENYDTTSFDFSKWKKCVNKVLTHYPHLLLTESHPQGEEILRREISKYIYSSRGVSSLPEQIFISAGTQQTTFHISNMLKSMGILNVSLESPGYAPVAKVFSDYGFYVKEVPVSELGVDIEALPQNINSALYVSPSNQFPTGSVMPIGERHKLLNWAYENNSYIIEDDYDSELRYFGRPIPPLQSLDTEERVIYLGSFSSTLFPAIKISYMVVPKSLLSYMENLSKGYTQTCSKTEQLALSFFMEDGKYMQAIKKMRRSYSQKIDAILNFLEQNIKNDEIQVKNTYSGITLSMIVSSTKSQEQLSEEAKSLGLNIVPSPEVNKNPSLKNMIFYYNTLPIEKLRSLMSALMRVWFK